MNFSKTIFFIILTIICSTFARGQNSEFKKYSYNHNDNYSILNFSLDIPSNWSINEETVDGTGYFLICKPINDSEVVKYSDCFEGIAFRIKSMSCNLDAALLRMGLEKQSDLATSEIYMTTFEGKIKILITKSFTGEKYKGIYYTINNDIICKDNKLHKVNGQYQYIYFSDGKQTICIITNGKSLEENVFRRIIESFVIS